jgi:pimeloyl-ACP methyl ester carboxylesterase
MKKLLGKIKRILAPRKEEFIVFGSQGGISTKITLPNGFNPKKDKCPMAILMHGFMSSKKMHPVPMLAETLAKEGIASICFDFNAHGKSEGEFIDMTIANEIEDAKAVFRYVNTLPYVTDTIFIGHSQGGRSSVNAANADSRIDCVISLAGSNYDYEVEGLKTPTFFIAGTSDMIVSPSQWIEPAYEIAEGPTVYASLNKAIHTTCSTNPEKYSSYILDWFDAWLKNDTAALKTFKDGGKLSKDSAWVDFRCKNI